VRRFLPITLLAIALLAVTGTAFALAPHGDWPTQTGPQIMHKNDESTPMHGTERNDRLLGGHGDDHIFGDHGHDVIWGDYKPTGNTTKQVDHLYGGPGKDWIYASHGRNMVYGGAGDDTIRVWFGRGFVDCGPGRDLLFLSKHRSRKKVKRVNCERISFKSARQVDEDGGPRVG
jgi:hypothetical protein